MERTLDPTYLGLALGDTMELPTPEEVSNLLARAELALLVQRPEVSDDLVEVAWYLHAVASSRYALGAYGLVRQRAAYDVSGHIFDLQLRIPGLSRLERLKYCFAAQVASLGCSLDPNAIALYRREFGGDRTTMRLLTHTSELALSCAVATLGFDSDYVLRLARGVRGEIDSLTRDWGIKSVVQTPFAAAAGVVLGSNDLLRYLVSGSPQILNHAKESFRNAIQADSSTEDQLSRWAAAHLLHATDGLSSSSIWAALPPDVSPAVRRAFTLGRPSVLTLWPPQLELFGDRSDSANSPLSPSVTRLFLSTPTSGGKTLLAQMLVAAHLVQEHTSVCYVAPTRSLCSEIRRSLEARMRFLGKEVISGLPEGNWLDRLLPSPTPDVEVMTPERLSYLIRTDAENLLNTFGMFIVDEVHMVGESSRGWTLEQDLTFLHYATQDSPHRIVLMSAAVGNRNHFVEWMRGSQNEVLHLHSAWRGPRRLHAIWTTEVDWSSGRHEPVRSRRWSERFSYDLHGVLHTRVSQSGQTHRLRTTDSVGELVLRRTPDGQTKKDDSRSTPNYKLVIPLVGHLSASGPVLIIESTRAQTIRTAKALAASLDGPLGPEIDPLIDLVQARLGSEHPLSQVLGKGVGYHHGSLPSEIRAAIEEAASEGRLRLLVATTTLTEGINLPVHSVVIASRGFYTSQGYMELITGPKLINAIGRAGRATKETEGIVVIAQGSTPTPADFERMNPGDSETQIISGLASEQALNDLASYEDTVRSTEDAVILSAAGWVSDFLTFVWLTCAQLERLEQDATEQGVRSMLRHTLAWLQLGPADRQRWLDVADSVLRQYRQTDPLVRQRWAEAGTSLRSAHEIEVIADEVAACLEANHVPENPVDAIQIILGDGRLQRLQDLPEAPKRRVYTQRAGARQEIDVPMAAILREWLEGKELVDLANSFFRGVADIDFRFEQLGDYISDYFDLYLPWVLSTIIGWANGVLESRGRPVLSVSIPANVRMGVSDSVALQLMSRGIPSRSLASRVAAVWRNQEQSVDVLVWIRSMSVSEWQQAFDASPGDLRSILDYARDRRGGVAVALITEGATRFEVASTMEQLDTSVARLEPSDESELALVRVYVGQQWVGYVLSRDQPDVRTILRTGLPLEIAFTATAGQGTLDIRIEQDR